MIPTENRERFVGAIVAQLGGASIIEAHFFAPRRMGGVESGVAVVAATPAPPPVEVAIEIAPEPTPADAAPVEEPADVAEPPVRYTIFTATYRHTLKGPERGKWETSVKAEAEAPLVTVDQVVRGVQRRAEDTDEVDRLSGEEIRALTATDLPAADAPATGGPTP